ncbi:MAG: response regulator [Anaerolineales bacterium]
MHPPDAQAFELSAAIEKAVEDTAALVSRRSVTVIAEYPAHLPMVAGQIEPLSVLISDLITDSIGGLDRGEIKVRAELFSTGNSPLDLGVARKLAEGGPWALVTIASRKDGSAFESRVGDSQGAGADPVGLPSAALALGGLLWSEADEQGYATLRLAVPLRDPGGMRADVSSLRRAVQSHLPTDGEGAKTLLVAVESEAVQAVLVHELEGQGYRVIAPGGSESLLAKARKVKPDLILIDVLFRGSTAFDLALLLKQDMRTRSIPVLFLTSMQDPMAGLRMEAARFVMRPPGTGALLAAVQSVLHSGVSPSARVLVVEPDARARESLIRMIQTQGYRVSEAETAEEAMALAERASPSLALLNARVAKDRDYWLLRQLRQLSSGMEILVLAEGGNERDARAVLQRGASGYGETGELSTLLSKVGRGNGTSGGSRP